MSAESNQSRLGIVARGFCMGCADAVPGVSGGTMAYILGIYERLLNALSHFDARFASAVAQGRLADGWRRVDAGFLLLLALGIVGALLFVTRVVDLPGLLEEEPAPVYGLFFGLIVGSLVLLVRGIGAHRPAEMGLFATGIVAGFLLVNLVPVSTPEAAWFVALSGALAISAMLVPGISGSYILLMLGKYEFVLAAIRDLRLLDLLPFAIGCAAGLLGFSRILGWLIKAYERMTVIVINGVLLGSLWRLWPFQTRSYAMVDGEARLISSQPVLPPALDADVMLPSMMIGVGVVSVLLIGWSARAGRRRAG